MKVRFATNEPAEIALEQGATVASALADEVVDIKHSCRGHGCCGLCLVTIEDGIETLVPPSENEQRVLRLLKATPIQRLACQAIRC
jgi:ferredoxin